MTGLLAMDKRARNQIARRAEKALGLRFRDRALLIQALTHGSWEKASYSESNERLEFLGDAVLKLIIADYAFRRNPRAREGELSDFLARLVSEGSISRASRRLGLGELLLMGRNLEASGGRSQSSILADAFEALLGAIFLDKGYIRCRNFVLWALSQEILAEEGMAPTENYKAILQEKLQKMTKSIPVYEVVDESGPDHRKVFTVRVVFEDRVLGVGSGHSKKEAEQNAARAALDELGG